MTYTTPCFFYCPDGNSYFVLSELIHLLPPNPEFVPCTMSTANFRISITFWLLCLFLGSCQPSDPLDLTRDLRLHLTGEGGYQDQSSFHWSVDSHGVVPVAGGAVGEEALRFADSAYLEVASGHAFFTGDYSISVWIHPTSGGTWTRILDFNQVAPASGPAVTFLFGRPDSTEVHLWLDQWVMHKGVAVESIVDFSRERPYDAALGYAVQLDQWQHLAVTYRAEAPNPLGSQTNTKGQTVPLKGEVTLYVNGQKHSTSGYCLSPQGTTTTNYIGRSLFPADPYYQGLMDDIRIYDRALSEKEIEALYALGE
ncbi:MAG TPA: hypothetical protein DCP28_05490 [Cytophagales bacterium]|nr:hypothetical protein [Cytophagales bacterium]